MKKGLHSLGPDPKLALTKNEVGLRKFCYFRRTFKGGLNALKKLRKSCELNGLSIITRTAGETSKKTLLMNWRLEKKRVSYYFVTDRHSLSDQQTYNNFFVVAFLYHIWFKHCDPGCNLRLSNCQNSHAYFCLNNS